MTATVVTPYGIVFGFITLVMAALALYVWKRRDSPGGLYFSLVLAAASVWAFACMAENLTPDISAKIMFSKLSYLGITTVGPLWLMFVLDYARMDRLLTKKNIVLLLMIPVMTIILVMTNEWHGIIWTDVTPIPETPDILYYAHGPGAAVYVTYSYLLIVTASLLLLWTELKSKNRNYTRTATLLIAALAPWITSILYVTRTSPIVGLDITPLAFGVTGLMCTLSIFGERLFGLVPLAREALIEKMSDGVLVLDTGHKIIDINPAAYKMLNLKEEVKGKHISQAMAGLPELSGQDFDRDDISMISPVDLDDRRIWVHMRASRLYDERNKKTGHLITISDVTGHKLAEEDLKQSNSALKAEVAERKQAEINLESSLKEKELLLKEIHHRVKNNLQIIDSLLSLQTTGISSADASSALRESQNRIRSMALVHEKLYRSRDLSRINFREYIESLTASISKSYVRNAGVIIEVKVDNIAMDIDRAIACGLIINELVSNSLKYAFKGDTPGKVNISLSESDGGFLLIVSDNGAGLPKDIDFKNTSSLGLQLVVTLVEQLSGNIELMEGKGTTYRITFKDI